VVPTLRPAYRQFEAIIKDLNYQPASRNPFDRLIDTDTPWRSNQELGGASATAEFALGAGTLTSTSAWRFWNWDPSNDRDFTGLQALRLSQAPSKHNQYSQEIRWAGSLHPKVTAVFGAFYFAQDLKSDPDQVEESGTAQWRFSQSSTSALWKTEGLLNGYGIKTRQQMETQSAALFGQLDIAIGSKLSLMPGLRYNYDRKSINFSRTTYGGLQTTDAALLALKRLVYTDQAFEADIDNTNLSGQLTLAYRFNKSLNSFFTYSTGFKPVGLNLGGLPSLDGKPMTELATVKPESVQHLEWGLKSRPGKNATLNLTVYKTNIYDFQTNVQTADLAVNRGYLANAEQVGVQGVELEGTVSLNKHFSFYGNVAYTDAKYVKFTNAPVPLEETGGATFKDISGGQLPGVSKWAGSFGVEYATATKLFNEIGEFFIALDSYGRSTFSSSPSPSKYLNIAGYNLLNARLGFKASKGLSVTIWSRNLGNNDYFELLLPGAGNAGHYAAVLGDPRTFGITIRGGI
jgi:iron complex outermembrane receptor protein